MMRWQTFGYYQKRLLGSTGFVEVEEIVVMIDGLEQTVVGPFGVVGFVELVGFVGPFGVVGFVELVGFVGPFGVVGFVELVGFVGFFGPFGVVGCGWGDFEARFGLEFHSRSFVK